MSNVKKIFKLLLLLFIPLFVNAEGCSINSISIIGVEPQEDSNYSSISKSIMIEDNTIHLDINMFNVGDRLSYKITLKNDSLEDYSINNLHINSESEYLSYQYVPEDHSNIIKAQSSKVVLLTVEYENEIPKELFESGNYVDSQEVKITVSNEVPFSEESSFSSIINPITGNVFYVIIFLFIICSLMFSLCKAKKNTNIHFLLIMVMLIPIGVKAFCDYEIEINSNVNIIIPRNLYDVVTDGAIMDNINSEFVNNDIPGIDFTKSASDENGKGIYIKSDTSEDDYPIYYYRGDVSNNNIIFADKCWKIVRTTDTGGTKLIYNGEQKIDYNHYPFKQNNYQDVESNTDSVYKNPFIYDMNTNEWVSIITDYNDSAFEFSIKESGSYKLKFHFKSGSSTGGSANYYLDGEKIESISFGGGYEVDKEYDIFVDGVNNNIKVDYFGSADISSPIELHISVEQNDVKLDESKYNVISNGNYFYRLYYDENDNYWHYSSPYHVSSTISFRISEEGDFLLKVPSSTGGPVYYKKNGVELLSTQGFILLSNVKKTDVFTIEYSQYSPGVVDMSFSIGTYSTKIYSQCGYENYKSVIDYQPFNDSYNSMSYCQYSYGRNYSWNLVSLSSGGYWAHDVNYSADGYSMVDSIYNRNGSPWDTDRHYFRNNATSFTYYFTRSYGITLTAGKKIEDVYNETFIDPIGGNKSKIRSIVEEWYENNNVNQYNDYLEDTKWCLDRSIYDDVGWKLNDSYQGTFKFSAQKRVEDNFSEGPQIKCSNENDYLSVEQGQLTYPIALLTADEVDLAGNITSNSKNNYLSSSSYFWLLSPSQAYNASICTSNGSNTNCVSGYYPLVLIHYSSGGIGSNIVHQTAGVRPVISLDNSVMILDGDGTGDNPYHVYYES